MKTNNVILKIDNKVNIIEDHRYFFEKACEIIVVDTPLCDILDVIKSSTPKMIFEFVENYRPILINLPGYDDVTINSYNWQEFLLFLPEKSSIYLLFNVDITLPGFRFGKFTELPNIFSEIVKYEVTNFPLTITELEKRGLVKTQPSQSWLSTDGRVFQIVGCIDDSVSSSMWEVDILGTTFGKQITQKILELYDKI